MNTNLAFITAVALLSTRYQGTDNSIQSFMYEDGSGYKFCAEVYKPQDKATYNIYFEVKGGCISTYVETKQEKQKMLTIHWN